MTLAWLGVTPAGNFGLSVPIALTTTRGLARAVEFDHWCAIRAAPTLDPARRVPNLAAELEHACNASAETWCETARGLTTGKDADLAHTPACAGNISDFGTMLGWDRLLHSWAASSANVLVVCDDPWLFRHWLPLADKVGPPPLLWPSIVRLALRGLVARSRVALRAIAAVLRAGATRRRFPRDSPTILVYGHPASRADGHDGYFGGLLGLVPGLARVLHVDCAVGRAEQLARDDRTFSLHAWGSWWRALALPFARWRPSAAERRGSLGWLIRRSAALEGSTGQPAMIRWQQICHEAWLRAAQPVCVAWPWENHAWERHFVRCAREWGVRTIGYQHATVGTREWNHSPRAGINADCLPDVVWCSGSEGRSRLLAFGLHEETTEIAGAWRSPALARLPYDRHGPVFVALPAHPEIAEEMVQAVRAIAANGRRFIVKTHPMTPCAFDESAGLARTDAPLELQTGLSGVLYAATTVGLEAAIRGLPTLRFQPTRAVANDVAPADIAVAVTDAAELAAALDRLSPPAILDPARFFCLPRMDLWIAGFSKGSAHSRRAAVPPPHERVHTTP